jgi:group I intron endonuclease
MKRGETMKSERRMLFEEWDLYKDKNGVYCITCLKNNKKYIGATTKSFRTRYDLHNGLLRRGKHNRKIQPDYDLYGIDSFRFDVLYVSSQEDTNETIGDIEREKIKEFDSVNNGYNIANGGDGGINFTAESKHRIAEKARKRMTGSKLSEENKKVLSESVRGMKRSEEQKKFLSIYFSGDNCNLAKLNEEQVVQIKTKLIAGCSYEDLATEFCVKPQTIIHIAYGRRWKYVKVDGWEDYQNSLRHIHYISEEQEIKILNDRLNGASYNYLYEKYGVSHDKVKNILKKYNK